MREPGSAGTYDRKIRYARRHCRSTLAIRADFPRGDSAWVRTVGTLWSIMSLR
jgi:hypothetical protein